MPGSSAIAAEKRRHIVETAYELFKRAGFHATGIDLIIARAEVAKMTMYRHFPNKESLIVEVLDWRAGRFARQLDRAMAARPTPKAKIATIFDWYERWFDSPDFHGCLFQHALAEFGEHDHPVFKAVARQKDELSRCIRKTLEAGMTAAQAQRMASTLVMLIEGATLLAQLGKGNAATRAIRDARKAADELLTSRIDAQ